MNNSENKKKASDYRKWIVRISIAAVLILVDIYLTAFATKYNLDDLLSVIEIEWLSNLIAFGINAFVLGSSFGIFYGCIYFVVKFGWKIKNKRYYLKGTWLHIHDKADAKIGVVEIEQDFFDLKFKATNMRPGSNDPNEGKTIWRYLATEFFPNEDSHEKLVGCYLAHRDGEDNKFGFHLYTEIKGSPYPNLIEGRFGDMLKPADLKNPNAIDKTGNVYLFKMPKCIKKHIGYKNDIYSFDRKKLADLINYKSEPDPKNKKAERIEDTEFCKKLKAILEKNVCRNQYKEVCKHQIPIIIANEAQENIDLYLAKILCKVVLCDEVIAKQERENLNYILGTEWDDNFIHQVFLSFDFPTSGELTVEEFISNLKHTDGKLWDKLKTLVTSATICLIHSDGVVNADEEQCKKDINELFEAKIHTTIG